MATSHQALLADSEYKVRLVTFNREVEKHLHCLFHDPNYGNFPNDQKKLYGVMIKLDKNGKLNHLRQDQLALVLPKCKMTDSRTFDMTLLCYFLLTNAKLPKSVRKDIEGLRDERNFIMHTPDITYDEFEKRWNNIKNFLGRLNYDVNIVEDLKSGSLDNLEQFQVSKNKRSIEIQNGNIQQNTDDIANIKDNELTEVKQRLNAVEEVVDMISSGQNEGERIIDKAEREHGLISVNTASNSSQTTKEPNKNPENNNSSFTEHTGDNVEEMDIESNERKGIAEQSNTNADQSNSSATEMCNTVSFSDDRTLYANITDLSPMKKSSDASSQYFSLHLFDGRKKKSAVCFKAESLSIFQKAYDGKRILKISNYRERQSKHPARKKIIIGDCSQVEFSDVRMDIGPSMRVIDKPPTTVNEVLTTIALDENINVEGVIDTKNTTIEYVLIYEAWKPKREVTFYDCKHYVKLDLWNGWVNEVTDGFSYKLCNVKVKSYKGRYLTTTPNTVIYPSKLAMTEPLGYETSLPEEVTFPPTIIDKAEMKYICDNCGREAGEYQEDFLQCGYCEAKFCLSMEFMKAHIKATFKTRENKIKLSIHHDSYMQFCELLNLQPKDFDDVQLKMLVVNDVKAVYSTRTNCITSFVKL